MEIDSAGWDGTGPDGAPFLLKRLPPRSGPTCEILLIEFTRDTTSESIALDIKKQLND